MKKVLLILILGFSTLQVMAERPNLQLGIHFGLNARVYRLNYLVATTDLSDPNNPRDTLFDQTVNGLEGGYHIGFFFRVTKKRKYAQVGVDFIRTSAPVFSNSISDTSASDDVAVFGVELPFLVGYRIVETPKFKWRLNTGLSMTILGKVNENDAGFKLKDYVNPRVGMRFGMGVDIAFFIVDFNYAIGLTREFRSISTRAQSHSFALTIGFVF